MNGKLKSFNVMVVDDDKLVQKLVNDVLLKLGFGDVYRAVDGSAALDLLITKPVDFIICDWRMKKMDGLKLVRLIRRGGTAANPLIPIIMLTGNAEAHQVLEARDAGVNEYLVKPFTVKELCKHVTEIVDHPRDFVVADQFKGPSRRRKSAVPPAGKQERRKSRIKPVKVGYVSRAK